MTIHTKEFKPTWLYIKIHNQTGLKYFGKTHQKDPIKYRGSGTHWLRHIKKYGYDVTTFIIGYYTDAEECNKTALFLSQYLNIVESSDWANLILEDGLGGGGIKGRVVSEETKQKIREKNSNPSDLTRQRKRDANLGKHHSEETKQKIREKNTGYVFTDDQKQNVSDGLMGHVVTEVTRDKMREYHRNRTPEHTARLLEARKTPTTDETREKMSRSAIERYKDPLEIEKLSAAAYLRTHTDETKQKIRDIVKGKRRFNDGVKNYHLYPTDPRVTVLKLIPGFIKKR